MKPYYQDEWVQIFNADCFDLLHNLEGIGAIITDPPYSSGGAFRSDRTQSTSAKYVNSDTMLYRPEFVGDNRDQRSFLAWCALWLNAARRACSPGAPLATFIDWRQLPIMTDAIQAGGWIWRNTAVWWKPGIRMQHGRFSSSAEFVLYGTNGPAAEGQGSPQNVFSWAPVGGDDKQHIAEKPVEVFRWIMQIVPQGAIILDPFMGTGSSLRAARDMGHRSIGIDVDERYCAIAAKRMAQAPMIFAEQQPQPEQIPLGVGGDDNG